MKLTLGTWDHDRVMALHDGSVQVPGVTLKSHIHPTAKLFPWAVQEARFDITEMSVSSYILQLSRGGSDYTAIRPSSAVPSGTAAFSPVQDPGLNRPPISRVGASAFPNTR